MTNVEIVYASHHAHVSISGTDVIVRTNEQHVRLELLEAIYELPGMVPEEAEREVCRALCRKGASCH